MPVDTSRARVLRVAMCVPLASTDDAWDDISNTIRALLELKEAAEARAATAEAERDMWIRQAATAQDERDKWKDRAIHYRTGEPRQYEPF